MQSGSPLSFWALHDPSTKFHKLVREVSFYVGCDSDDVNAQLKCMMDVEPSVFVDKHFDVSFSCAAVGLSYVVYKYSKLKYAVYKTYHKFS